MARTAPVERFRTGRDPDPRTRVGRGRGDQRFTRIVVAVGILVAGFLAFAVVATLSEERAPSVYDDTLPNPMGGPARLAPGSATGTAVLAGLEVQRNEVAMGDVPLGVTVVPEWQVDNATDDAVTFEVGQPQVLAGCCPGPVYVDGELTASGQAVTVPAGSTALIQFPLQMHAGMDGPHHLTIPLTSGGEQAAVHVTGNFTADARA